jgi:hypothetical protein
MAGMPASRPPILLRRWSNSSCCTPPSAHHATSCTWAPNIKNHFRAMAGCWYRGYPHRAGTPSGQQGDTGTKAKAVQVNLSVSQSVRAQPQHTDGAGSRAPMHVHNRHGPWLLHPRVKHPCGFPRHQVINTPAARAAGHRCVQVSRRLLWYKAQ